MKIYLIGFMGAGKTTIGRLLADRLGVPFFDLDELVEASEGMSIKELFADKGEPHFRKRERDLLQSTRYLEDAVIATGGGTFTFEENIQLIQSEGLSIYLAASFPLLLSRIGEKAAERPLFRDEMATHQLHQSRLKFYRLSDLTIEIREEETPEEVLQRIVILLPKEILAGARRRGGRVS
ncbi:MAG TPA: shikimate kinase [Thermoanaerobaculia bacterium]|nr:shikimate kinase [Thermoanaerobaculia bacterium]